MANRLNYFFRQKVTEAELDLGFAYLEQADRALAVDLGIKNVALGLGVAQQTVANLTVKVAGPGAAYDTQGRRIPIASDQNVNCALDFNNVSTAVTTPGNEKWLALFVYFDRTLTDSRVDGNSATVYFQEAETAKFKVVQGAEAAIGVATRPGLLVDHVLLADVRLINGQTQIVNADISTTRRQTFFDLAGTPFSIKQGQFSDALGEMLGHLNTHITSGGPGVHQATSVSYAGSGNWADGSQVTSTNVEAAIDEVVSDLAATTGAPKIGAAATAGASYSLSSGSVKSQLDALLAGLNTRGAANGLASLDGSTKVPLDQVHGALVASYFSGEQGGWSQAIPTTATATDIAGASGTLASPKNGDILVIEANGILAFTTYNPALGTAYCSIVCGATPTTVAKGQAAITASGTTQQLGFCAIGYYVCTAADETAGNVPWKLQAGNTGADGGRAASAFPSYVRARLIRP